MVFYTAQHVMCVMLFDKNLGERPFIKRKTIVILRKLDNRGVAPARRRGRTGKAERARSLAMVASTLGGHRPITSVSTYFRSLPRTVLSSWARSKVAQGASRLNSWYSMGFISLPSASRDL